MPQEMNARVSKALADYMADHDISRADIARRLGRSNSYVGERLSGERALSLDIMSAAADLTRVSMEALMVELTTRMRTAR